MSTVPLDHDNEPHGSAVPVNDNVDILAEIMSRLDGRSLGAAACVCRLWSNVCRRDSVWEALCNQHVAGGGPGLRGVVTSLGGYRLLYRVCIGPVLDRMGRVGWNPAGEDPARLSLALSLS